jgi:hypothetical protein
VGLFKQMKDMKQMVDAAPDMVKQAQQMGAQAQEMQAAQMAAAQQQMAAAQTAGQPGGVSDAELEPIAGVSLEQYATISKGLAAYGYDQSKAVEVAASHGVSPESWQQALEGWNARIKANRAIGAEFNKLYTGS